VEPDAVHCHPLAVGLAEATAGEDRCAVGDGRGRGGRGVDHGPKLAGLAGGGTLAAPYPRRCADAPTMRGRAGGHPVH
jgi:hypothetical protein